MSYVSAPFPDKLLDAMAEALAESCGMEWGWLNGEERDMYRKMSCAAYTAIVLFEKDEVVTDYLAHSTKIYQTVGKL